ncbi:receptor kinase 3 [Perilla frutescens var. frutescens]|nr:receptor kinase 3 [Perilla frutescens var. frutescens]
MINTAEHHRFCLVVWCYLAAFTLFPLLTTSINRITPTQSLTKGQTLVSARQEFELGFFSSGISNNWYVGIWYKHVEERTIVWVANRDSPLRNSSGILKISADEGKLILVDQAGRSVWSANHSGNAGNIVAELLDHGNLVLRRENDGNPENYLWESFNYPTDTLLPGMKLGWDSKTGLNRYITSWKSADDPSTGDYSFKLNIYGYPEIYLTNKQTIDYRSGAWNGLRFSGVPEMKPSSPLLSFLFVRNPNEEVSYSFSLMNESMYSRLMMKHSGALQRFIWIPSSRIWNLFWYAPKDQCDDYRECGVYGICDANASPVCKCMKAFQPKNQQAWNLRDGSDGCVRVSELDCNTDGFLPMNSVKLPESGTAYVNDQMNLNQCREMCRKNCSCRGYSSANISDGSGCVIWAEDLYDMRQYAASEGGGQDFYFRVPAAELVTSAAVGSEDDSNKTRKIIMIAGIVVGSGALVVGVAIFLVWKRRKSNGGNVVELRGPRERSQDYLLNAPTIPSKRDHSGEAAADEIELPLFDITTLVIATNKFSDENKLGQGGFGIVYKGVLAEGEEIAVKRLSKTSVQGIDEFKNEVKLIARLQHRNLVRLLGCCIEMEEKMLVYEYMENKSLDSMLFNKSKSSMLEWQRRFKIICGIARGLLYLHQDSRFRIIHRDLKASNILLDKDMDPKISDFGMARIFGGDQTEANTKRVVGTYGYMSPEYAMDGLFSIKSDVFSFGVLVLEIVSGTKNRGFYQTNNQLNLLAYAWKLYREGRGIEVVDSAAGEEYSESEVMRCIQVGLLCVQEHAQDRPDMSTVVLMLSTDFPSIPQPKHPGYCVGNRHPQNDSSSAKLDETCTVNQLTLTIIDAR